MPLRKPFRRTGKRAGRFSEQIQGMAPSEPYFNELKKKYGEQTATKAMEQADAQLRREFAEKTAVKIPMHKKVIVQPTIDVEYDPKLKDRGGFSSSKDGAGNIYINVGANASGAMGEERKQQTISTSSGEKAQINLPERPHTGNFGGHNVSKGIDLNTPEHKAADWLNAVRVDVSYAAKGYGSVAKTYAEKRAENRLATRMNRHLTMPGKHPIQFLRNTRDLAIHPVKAVRNSWMFNATTNRGLRKQVRLSRQASQRIVILGKQTDEKISRAMEEYRKRYAENRFKAVPWIEKELYGITSDYTREKEAILLGPKRQQGAMAFEPYGIFGRRRDNTQKFLARATKAWRD